MAEQRISPTIIIPISLGLALGGLVSLAYWARAAAPGVYPCPVCGQEFATPEEVEEHLAAEHPVLPSIDVTGFHYVYQGIYTWSLGGTMLHGRDITHIGFNFRNNEAIDVPGVSVRFSVTDGGERELSPPLDQYLMAISQPFTVAPGTASVWYRFTPAYARYLAVAEVLVGGSLVASGSLEFTVPDLEVPELPWMPWIPATPYG